MFPYRSAVMFLAVSFAGISISAKDYRLTSPGENLKVKEDFFGAVSEKSGILPAVIRLSETDGRVLWQGK